MRIDARRRRAQCASMGAHQWVGREPLTARQPGPSFEMTGPMLPFEGMPVRHASNRPSIHKHGSNERNDCRKRESRYDRHDDFNRSRNHSLTSILSIPRILICASILYAVCCALCAQYGRTDGLAAWKLGGEK